MVDLAHTKRPSQIWKELAPDRRQMAADAFGIDVNDVEVLHGDTDVVTHGVGTFGSRGLVVGGTAVHMALEKVTAKASRIAARVDPKPRTRSNACSTKSL